MWDRKRTGNNLLIARAVELNHGLLKYFRRRAHADDIDDLMQELLLNLHAASDGAPIDEPDRYIFTAAKNTLSTHRRRSRMRHSGAHDLFDENDGPAEYITPDRVVIGKQEYARAMAAVANLPPRMRLAFNLHRFEHMTYREIADRMNISKESVKDHMRRALVKIADEMAVDDADEE